tara:strand:+ start:434 stop:757 length:324 start_codon:yes stop_codon:yes gene_type:complete
MASFFIGILFAPFCFTGQTAHGVLQPIVGHVESGAATGSHQSSPSSCRDTDTQQHPAPPAHFDPYRFTKLERLASAGNFLRTLFAMVRFSAVVVFPGRLAYDIADLA